MRFSHEETTYFLCFFLNVNKNLRNGKISFLMVDSIEFAFLFGFISFL